MKNIARRRRQRRKDYVREPGDMHTIESFCEANRISVGTYYALRKASKGPRETRVGKRRVLISPQAEQEWRHTHEAESSATRREANGQLYCPPSVNSSRQVTPSATAEASLHAQILLRLDDIDHRLTVLEEKVS